MRRKASEVRILQEEISVAKGLLSITEYFVNGSSTHNNRNEFVNRKSRKLD